MKIRYAIIARYVMVLLTGCILASCETDVKIPKDDLKKLVLNAIATPDTMLMADITMASDGAYLHAVRPSTCEVTAIINDTDIVGMYKNEESEIYVGYYIPKPGDKITITASNPLFPEAVSASATVPPMPDCRIECEKKYDFQNVPIYVIGRDTVANVKVHLHNPDPTEKCYRITMMSDLKYTVMEPNGEDSPDPEGFHEEIKWLRYEDFECTSPLLSAPGKTMNQMAFYGFWVPSGDSELVLSLRYGYRDQDIDDAWLIVTIQEITQEMYNYLQSVYLYNKIPAQSIFNESIVLVSNCRGGYGNLNAYSSKTFVLPVADIPLVTPQ